MLAEQETPETSGQCEPVSTLSEPVKKRSFPVKKAVDWPTVQREYVSMQFMPKDIAAKHGITLAHLYKYAERNGWARVKPVAAKEARRSVQKAIAATVAKATQTAQPVIEAAVREWQERVLGAARTAVGHTERQLSTELPVEELKTVVSALDVADKVGRRALGLDRDTGSTGDGSSFKLALGLRLELLDSRSVADIASPVVDVDPV